MSSLDPISSPTSNSEAFAAKAALVAATLNRSKTAPQSLTKTPAADPRTGLLHLQLNRPVSAQGKKRRPTARRLSFSLKTEPAQAGYLSSMFSIVGNVVHAVSGFFSTETPYIGSAIQWGSRGVHWLKGS